jgi:hypothetical protein
MNYVEEALLEYFGPRCRDYVVGCCVCAAYKQYDALVKRGKKAPAKKRKSARKKK